MLGNKTFDLLDRVCIGVILCETDGRTYRHSTIHAITKYVRPIVPPCICLIYFEMMTINK